MLFGNTTTIFLQMSDFDEADKQAVVPSVPKSSNKVVLLGAKVLQTHKEVRKVLPEEKYVDNLEKIIVRDYFPELPKLKVCVNMTASFIVVFARPKRNTLKLWQETIMRKFGSSKSVTARGGPTVERRHRHGLRHRKCSIRTHRRLRPPQREIFPTRMKKATTRKWYSF